MANVFGSSVDGRVGLIILSHACGKNHKLQSFCLDTHAHIGFIGNSTESDRLPISFINLNQYEGSTHISQQQKQKC